MSNDTPEDDMPVAQDAQHESQAQEAFERMVKHLANENEHRELYRGASRVKKMTI